MLFAYAKTKARISCVKVQISCVVTVYDQLCGLNHIEYWKTENFSFS